MRKRARRSARHWRAAAPTAGCCSTSRGPIRAATGSSRLAGWAPAASAHKTELQRLADFPGRVVPYARWEELHGALRELVAGKTVAMEISPQDDVPYLDRVPYGVVELIQSLGGKVVSSAPLVTRFAARWSAEEAARHVQAAEVLARIAREALAFAVTQGGKGLTESALMTRVSAAMEAEGLVPDHAP